MLLFTVELEASISLWGLTGDTVPKSFPALLYCLIIHKFPIF